MEDLLQKHTLVEADISAQAERVKAVQSAAKRFTSNEQSEDTPTFTLTLGMGVYHFFNLSAKYQV